MIVQKLAKVRWVLTDAKEESGGVLGLMEIFQNTYYAILTRLLENFTMLGIVCAGNA